MNHQFSGRNQKPRGIKVNHVLLVILVLVMGIWSIFQFKHSGFKLLVKKFKDGSVGLGRKGLVESGDGSEMDFHDVNVIIENSNEEESGNGDADEKAEEMQAEELYKQLFGNVNKGTVSSESAHEAKPVSNKTEVTDGNTGFQDETGVPPEGHESKMPAKYEPRSGGLSMGAITVNDSDNDTEVGTNQTEKPEALDRSIETNGLNEKSDDGEKDLNVDTNYDENLETQK